MYNTHTHSPRILVIHDCTHNFFCVANVTEKKNIIIDDNAKNKYYTITYNNNNNMCIATVIIPRSGHSLVFGRNEILSAANQVYIITTTKYCSR